MPFFKSLPNSKIFNRSFLQTMHHKRIKSRYLSLAGVENIVGKGEICVTSLLHPALGLEVWIVWCYTPFQAQPVRTVCDVLHTVRTSWLSKEG